MLELLKDTRKHLVTGVSYMLPFVVAGGVLLALSVMLSGTPSAPESGILKDIWDIGVGGMSLFVPIMGGFIAFSMVDRPGIAPGAIGAYLANSIGAGFLGGMLAGILAGIVVYYLKRIKVPPIMRSIMPIFIIPLVGTFVVGGLIVWVLGIPIAALMTALTTWLSGMSGTSKIVLGIILGSMIAFDMGGPLNKVAFGFAVGLVATNPQVMAAVGVAICTPPLGLALATFIAPKKFTTEEKESGKAAIIMGLIGITEGAIPFAAADPLRVIPSIMVGGAAGSVTSLLLNAANHAPWGGWIVLPVVENIFGYIIATIVGVVVTALMVSALKKPASELPIDTQEDLGDELDIDFE
ncbi:fructose-specific PTS system IIC-like component [Alkalibaculum bacchi]|uniref:Fructose-specific PTS system IIC-like component n=1 Tax=Alkalibaculum bacchi TaxID=645887 RepID=A0A366HYJ2_9FIRM|nr:PTS fructose transporter subunit EIIC [Alkalibaculum bacchi]RBP58739.1 fructose-specific PTS system IIC-like component [Alkalibaculum bacchi]